MKFLSVCSGIEAASVAWNPIGWKALAFSEIEKFPSALLSHHYPETQNLGDMTKFKEWPNYANVDLLCGGTPCQSFSVAGLRKGLDDPRGNLMLTFGSIAAQYRPRWLVWENVAGVLSSNKGRDFGSFLGLLGLIGYGFAYRIFDAQYFGVAQRRRRVFVVGYLGDWRPASAVLFERHSLQRNTPPSREARQSIAHSVAPCIGASGRGFSRAGETRGQDPVIAVPDPAYCLSGGGSKFGSGHHNQDTFIAHTLRGEGFDASEAGTGRGTPLVPVGIGGGELGFALRANPSHSGDKGDGGLNTTLAIAFHGTQDPDISGDITHPMGRNQGQEQTALIGARVRRLTPKECERLQGFQDIQYFSTIWVCSSDHLKNCVRAEIQNLKSLKSAFNVAESGLSLDAKNAETISSTRLLGQERHVALSVRIDLERGGVLLSRAGKLIWSANSAEKQNSFPLSMPTGNFVLLVARLLQERERETLDGRAGLLNSTNHFSPLLSGSKPVAVSGLEIKEFAEDAASLIKATSQCMKSTISGVGLNSQTSDSPIQILSCCVAAAINGFIPDSIRRADLYAINLEAIGGYTAIPYRGKAAKDGPRYKALGNSWAVPCARWIGDRINMVDKLKG